MFKYQPHTLKTSLLYFIVIVIKKKLNGFKRRKKKRYILTHILWSLLYKLLSFIQEFIYSNGIRHFEGITINKTTWISRSLWFASKQITWGICLLPNKWRRKHKHASWPSNNITDVKGSVPKAVIFHTVISECPIF